MTPLGPINIGMGGYVWNKLFRASVIKRNPTLKFDEKLSCYEDLKFVLEFLKRTDKVEKINEVVYVYNKDNINSISHMQINYQNICKLKGLEDICELLETFPEGQESIASRKNQLLKMCTSFWGRLSGDKNNERNDCIELLKGLFKKNSQGFKFDSTWDLKHKLVFYMMKIVTLI